MGICRNCGYDKEAHVWAAPEGVYDDILLCPDYDEYEEQDDD